MMRNFQLGTAVVIVAALAGIYLNTRDHRELERDAPIAAVPTATAALPLATGRTVANRRLVAGRCRRYAARALSHD